MNSFVSRITSPGALIITALSVGYGYYNRFFEVRTAVRPVGILEMLRFDLGNPQFVSFVLVTSWLVYLVAAVHITSLFPARLRLGSYRSAAFAALRDGFSHLTAVGLLVFLGSIVTTLGLSLTTSFATPQVLAGLVAIALQLLVLILTFLVIQLLVFTVRVVFGSRTVELVAVGVLWLWFGASATGLIPASAPLTARFFLSGEAVLSAPQQAVTHFGTMLLLAGALFFAIRMVDRRAVEQPLWRRPWLILLTTTGIVLLLATATLKPGMAWTETVLRTFSGEGTLIQLLVPVIVTVGFAYMFHLRMGELRDGPILSQLIRHGSSGRWMVRTLTSEARRAPMFLAVVLAESALFYILAGASHLQSSRLGFGLVLYHFEVNGTLQILVYLCAVLTVVWLAGSALGGLLVLSAVVVLSAVQVAGLPWLPVGLNGMAFLLQGWRGAVQCTISLLIALAALALCLAISLKFKRTPN